MTSAVLGLDIGGANLKAAHSAGVARLLPFALWRHPTGLADALRGLIASMPLADRLAVTMTGELCDCYESKRHGVAAILDAVVAAAPGLPARVWCNDGQFREDESARREPLLCASANWLALATFAGRFAPDGPALLLDVGSTTTDVIPLLNGCPCPRGRTDPERLRSAELIYRGVRRTPVCVLLAGEGAAELFATTLDIYLLLHYLPEDATDHDTADGRPATRAAAHARLARMFCADLDTSDIRDRMTIAETAHSRMVHQLAAAVEQVAHRLPGSPRTVVLSGSGEFLAMPVLALQRAFPPCAIVSLCEKLGATASIAACAHAVAILCAEGEK